MTHGAFITRSIYLFRAVELSSRCFSSCRHPRRHRIGAWRRRHRPVHLCLSATLAAIDWVMAVEPDWSSRGIRHRG